ncbi:PAQR family membrane homeostasis protein TrhA [Celeribacter sp.]|uniref:PAQR family membrane homeostasis protein TrhA n=1 Tax=Celeribacter sp. TaxID=1890673 RepID=UPI003A93FAC0
MSMSAPTYPSPIPSHRHADLGVHIVGLILILSAGSLLIAKAAGTLDTSLMVAVMVYIACALISNLASFTYHFAPLHSHRKLLRRIDHSAIYPSITGTFTVFFVQAGTTWSLSLMWLCWGLSALAIWKKVTSAAVKSKWSTASYLGLGAIGLCAVPDLHGVPAATIWCILGGAVCYVIGTSFYVRKTMPFRYAIWHIWVNLGGIAMFAGIWLALFA